MLVGHFCGPKRPVISPAGAFRHWFEVEIKPLRPEGPGRCVSGPAAFGNWWARLLPARRELSGAWRLLLGIGTGGLAPCRYRSELSVGPLCSCLVVMPPSIADDECVLPMRRGSAGARTMHKGAFCASVHAS